MVGKFGAGMGWDFTPMCGCHLDQSISPTWPVVIDVSDNGLICTLVDEHDFPGCSL